MRLWPALLALALMGPASARGPEEPPTPPVFPRLFPEPTGANGYEEIVLAGDLVKGSKTIAAAEESGATLTTKRRALADPANARALALLRQGLAKPIRSPRQSIKYDTLFPDFALLRQLARLLAIEQYVLLADGKTAAAIDSLRDGLRLGYTVKPELLIGGLVGAAVDATVLNRLAKHVEQLSMRDCDRLVTLARDYLNAPDPTAATLEAERLALLASLDELLRNPDTFTFGILPSDPEDEDDEWRSSEKELKALKENPSALNALVEQVTGIINGYYAPQIAALRLPYWKRTGPTPAINANDSLAGRIAAMFVSNPALAVARFTQNRAQVQLLGVHAAIRRFRWEHDRLPDGITDLRLGSLAIDPFTGQPLVYQRTGETTYELYSAGPPKRDNDGNVVPSQREPVFLPRRPSP